MSARYKSVTGDGTRLAWGLAELAASAGVSLGLLRKEVKRGALRTKKIGRRVVVMRDDWVSYVGHLGS